MDDEKHFCPKCQETDSVFSLRELLYSKVTCLVYESLVLGNTTLDDQIIAFHLGKTRTSLFNQQLKPPACPVEPIFNPTWIYFTFLGVLIAWISLEKSNLNLAGYSGYIFCGIFFLIIFLVQYKKFIEKKKAYECIYIPIWAREVQDWLELFYCKRCDGVFKADDRVLVKPKEKHDQFIEHISRLDARFNMIGMINNWNISDGIYYVYWTKKISDLSRKMEYYQSQFNTDSGQIT